MDWRDHWRIAATPPYCERLPVYPSWHRRAATACNALQLQQQTRPVRFGLVSPRCTPFVSPPGGAKVTPDGKIIDRRQYIKGSGNFGSEWIYIDSTQMKDFQPLALLVTVRRTISLVSC